MEIQSSKIKFKSSHPSSIFDRVSVAQDMRELRYRGWEERRQPEGPRTIAEVHAEAALELHQQTMAQRYGYHHSNNNNDVHTITDQYKY